ncbi:uncharacterized protein [Antedon mediterranea]|uniref:uncharacterized protein n=1 Tax=Antedon mediterranea TaxID=105859 RepID=UPI003AF63499
MDEKKKKKTRPTRTSLSAVLNNFANCDVIPRQRYKESIQLRVVNRVIEPILRTVGEMDDRFCISELGGRLTDENGTTSKNASVRLNARHHTVVNRTTGMNKNNVYEFDLLVVIPNLFVNFGRNAFSGGENNAAGGRSKPTLKSSTKEDKSVTFIDSTCCNNPYTPVLNGFGYLAINADNILVHDLVSCLNDSVDNIGRGIERETYLCPHKFVQTFSTLVSEAVEELDKKCFWEKEPTVFEVKLCNQGSGINLKILLAGETFTVDILPALLLHSWPESMNSWYKQHLSNKWLSSQRIGMVKKDLYLICDTTAKNVDERLWKVCYEKSECTLLEYADSHQVDSCRYKAYSILETLIEDNAADFAPWTPRLLRNIFIEQCIQYPHDEDWYGSKLGRAFVDLFQAIISSIKSCESTHVFTQNNLLKGAGTESEMKQISRHLKAILQDIIKQPDKSAFLSINDQ